MNYFFKSLANTLGIILYISMIAFNLICIGLITYMYHLDKDHSFGVVESMVFIYTFIIMIIIYHVGKKAIKIAEESNISESKKMALYFLTPSILSLLIVVSGIISFIYLGFLFTVNFTVMMVFFFFGAKSFYRDGAQSYKRLS